MDKNNVMRFPGLDDVLSENIASLEGAVEKFDIIVDSLDNNYVRKELEKYKVNLEEIKIKTILELLVDDGVGTDAKIYMFPNDAIKSIVVSLQERIDAIETILKEPWLE